MNFPQMQKKKVFFSFYFAHMWKFFPCTEKKKLKWWRACQGYHAWIMDCKCYKRITYFSDEHSFYPPLPGTIHHWYIDCYAFWWRVCESHSNPTSHFNRCSKTRLGQSHLGSFIREEKEKKQNRWSACQGYQAWKIDCMCYKRITYKTCRLSYILFVQVNLNCKPWRFA